MGNGITVGQVIIGSTADVASLTTIQGGGSAARGIVLQTGTSNATAGFISIVPQAAVAASPTATAVANTRVGVAIFTGFTTAAAGTQAFTITNSSITSTSFVNVTVANISAAGTAFLGIQGVVQAAGSIVVNCINNGATALAGNVLISFVVNS
jgi:hypothetical protein